MRVICPNCDFEREIDEDKIPARAQLATCPRCKTKFRFRELPPEDEFMLEEDAAVEAAPRDWPDPAGPDLRRQEAPETIEKVARPDHADDKPRDDIWGRLDALGDAEHARKDGEEDEEPSLSARPQAPEWTPPRDQRPMAEDEAPERPEQSWEHGGERRGSSGRGRPTPPPFRGEREFIPASSGEVPFERLDKYGFFPGLLLTIKQVLFQSPDFFRRMPTRGGHGRPIVYYMLLCLFEFALRLLSIKYLGLQDAFMGQFDSLMQGPGQDMALGGSGPLSWGMILTSLILSPAIFLLVLYLYSGVTHLFLMIFQGAQRGFEATLRVTAYAYTPMLFAVIPVVGYPVSMLWSLALLIIGLRQAHRTSFARVGMALFSLAVIMIAVLTYITGIVFELAQQGMPVQ